MAHLSRRKFSCETTIEDLPRLEFVFVAELRRASSCGGDVAVCCMRAVERHRDGSRIHDPGLIEEI